VCFGQESTHRLSAQKSDSLVSEGVPVETKKDGVRERAWGWSGLVEIRHSCLREWQTPASDFAGLAALLHGEAEGKARGGGDLLIGAG
jgi:hypothetical protein